MRIIKYSFIIIVLAAVSYGGYFFYILNVPNNFSHDSRLFKIQPKWGSVAISQELKKQGFIRDWVAFEMYVWFRGKSSMLQPGEYSLRMDYNIKEIAQVLTRKAENVTFKEVTLTFIEGWNNQQYAEYLEKQGFGKTQDFIEAVQKKQAWWDDYAFLYSRPKDRDLEGYLFPDTYRVYQNATIKDIIQKMLDNFGAKLAPELLAEIKDQGKTVHEIITLASIIEKEVPTDSERKMVSDIFHKRLAKGIGLQSDATVNYITGKGTVQPSLDDTNLDNPYNTYKYRGLPPGPICNPSLSAIIAAIYPTPNDYWYFLTTPEGKVIYSKTYDEHLAAKRKYLK